MFSNFGLWTEVGEKEEEGDAFHELKEIILTFQVAVFAIKFTTLLLLYPFMTCLFNILQFSNMQVT